jgi:vacuolar-type H+-ATPase subunit I/STV1
MSSPVMRPEPPCQLGFQGGVRVLIQKKPASPCTPSPASSLAQRYRAQSRPVLSFNPSGSSIKKEPGTQPDQKPVVPLNSTPIETSTLEIKQLEREKDQLEREKDQLKREKDQLEREKEQLKYENQQLKDKNKEHEDYTARIEGCAEDMEEELKRLQDDWQTKNTIACIVNIQNELQKNEIEKLKHDLEVIQDYAVVQATTIDDLKKQLAKKSSPVSSRTRSHTRRS